MLANLVLHLAAPLAAALLATVLFGFTFLPDSSGGKFTSMAAAVFDIPGIIANGHFTFLEFNRTFDAPTALDSQGQLHGPDSTVYLLFNGWLSPAFDVNWGNRLQIQLLTAGPCDTATRLDSGAFPNCNDDVFLHNRALFNQPNTCPQSELTCMQRWCGVVGACGDACAW
jgi:hypothetical protein